MNQSTHVAGEQHLYTELQVFPRRLAEWRNLSSESYTLALSGRSYEQERVSRGTHFCGSSSVERVVTRILACPYFVQLQCLIDATYRFYLESAPDDQHYLLCFWRHEPLPSPFPQRLMYRYQFWKEYYRVKTDAIEDAEAQRATPAEGAA